MRTCVSVNGGPPRIAARPDLPTHPAGDLLQAGPMLVRAGDRVVRDGRDPEGFQATASQLDGDVTSGRDARAAFGIAGGMLLAVAVDGRAPDEAGMTLGELAELFVGLGARFAINLDGGQAASLVCGGRLRNAPRDRSGTLLDGGAPVATALVFSG
jgi:exopolysaccharide biosynthesis protein